MGDGYHKNVGNLQNMTFYKKRSLTHQCGKASVFGHQFCIAVRLVLRDGAKEPVSIKNAIINVHPIILRHF